MASFSVFPGVRLAELPATARTDLPPKEKQKMSSHTHDLHSKRAGLLAHDGPQHELGRRAYAERVMRRFREQRTKFGESTVSILHEELMPPLLTEQQWDDQYGEIFDLVDPRTQEQMLEEKQPRLVRTYQKVRRNIVVGQTDSIVFRGDSRGPQLIFSTGFARKDLTKDIELGSEKTFGAISTSTSADVVRRKYGNCGEYVYACWLGKGIDTHDFNGLEEVIALHIPPSQVIVAAGPITKPSVEEQFANYRLFVEAVTENMGCTVPSELKARAIADMNKICDVAKKAPGQKHWEV